MLCFFSFLLVANACVAKALQNKDIFILAGQSNMAGRGGVDNGTWDHVIPSQCQPKPWINRLNAGLVWEEAREPLHIDIDVGKTCGVGPGLAFANGVVSEGVVGLVPCAVGGTAISKWAKGGGLYDQLVRRAVAGLESGGSVRAILWYQGESDTVVREDAELYGERLERLILNLRADLQSPTLLVILVGIASGEGHFVKIVREAQQGIDLPNVRYVDAKGLPLEPDQLHLTTSAQVRLGAMLAQAYLQTLPTPAFITNYSALINTNNRLMGPLLSFLWLILTL